MSLRFPYKRFRSSHPLQALPGYWQRSRPVLPITLIGPAGTWVGDGLADSGADDTVFPETVARLMGLDLTGAPEMTAAGIARTRARVRFAQVTLRLADNHEKREWTAWVGFTPVTLFLPMLGHSGFMQFFTTTFRDDIEEVELEVNTLYPGT